MSNKQILLFSIFAVASIFSGLTFGLLDVFGFIDGRHTVSFTLLTSGAILLYISLICVFLLDIAHTRKIYAYTIVSSIFFGCTFFIMNMNPFLSCIATLSYYALLHYASYSTTQRFNLYIRFSPKEIFFPVLKNSFFYILIMLSLLAYGQSQKLISEHSLITPDMLRVFVKPSVVLLTQQINSQLHSELGPALATMTEKERIDTIRLVLLKTVDSMADKETGMIYGIPKDQVPIDKAEINSQGKVDLQPVFQGMLPALSSVFNARIAQYALITPFVIALFTFLIFQPLTIPLQLVESVVTTGLFKALIATKFIKLHTETTEVDRLSL
jgi:hypothetical protein